MESTAPTPSASDGLPESVDTAQTKQVVADVDTLVSQAKSAVAGQIDDAVSAASKLLQSAAGDAPQILTDAEAAAISIVVHNIPPQYQPIVQAFAAAAASSAEGAANAVAETGVQHGLAWSLAWLKTLQAAADKVLG